MSHLLEVRNLTVSVKKKNNDLKIIEKINFSIDEGEILGLAGESGCGKSMTALSIANLLPKKIKITEGEIIFDNINLSSLNEKEFCSVRGNKISFIFQDVKQSLNPLMKAGKQITESLVLGGSKDKKQNKKIALELLDSLGFREPEKIYDSYPHQLSGGMCQRVMTAIALIRRPKLLLGDEPSSSLDEESQEICMSVIKEMNLKQKMSLLIISHDLSIIQKFANRFIIMYAGRIVEEGPSFAIQSPLHPYTKALINANPEKNKRGKKLYSIPGRPPSPEDKINGCPFAPRCRKAQSICSESFPPLTETENRKVYCYFPEMI